MTERENVRNKQLLFDEMTMLEIWKT